METLLSDNIKEIIGLLATDVNDLNKEYATEKISSKDKKEQIKSTVNIAQYRIISAVKSTVNEVLSTLKTERINPTVYDRIKELFNDRL